MKVCVCIDTTCVLGVPGVQKKLFGSPRSGIQDGLGHLVGVGTEPRSSV